MSYMEFEFVKGIEKHFECSGMCLPSLFYFGQDITVGVPRNTCLRSLRKYTRDNSLLVAIFSIVTGVLALISFFLHPFLYGRNRLDEMQKAGANYADIGRSKGPSTFGGNGEIELGDGMDEVQLDYEENKGPEPANARKDLQIDIE
jgi:hypothetical protein